MSRIATVSLMILSLALGTAAPARADNKDATKVTETPQALEQFISSRWELGGQTSVAAKAGDKGAAFQGAVTVAPGVWLYQLTETGLALELTAKGTKYYKDDSLN